MVKKRSCPEPSCSFYNRPVLPDDAKVCPMCGTSLGSALEPLTDLPSPEQQPSPPQPPIVQPQYQQPPYQPPPVAQPQYQQPPYQPPPVAQPQYQPSPVPPHTPSPPRLLFSHLRTGREYSLRSEMGVIGRRDPAGQNSPEIDLSGIPDEGVISRTHARVYWDTTQNTYMVVDTSRNGTYLNAKQLTPGTPYRLGHGDELQLGQNKLVCLRVLLM